MPRTHQFLARVVLLSLLFSPAAQADVTHVVFSWFKPDAPAGALEAAIENGAGLAGIPGVLELRSGAAVPSERSIVDDSFDIGLTMRFADIETMNAYLAHPDHVAYVETFIKPYAARILVYDIQDQN